MLNSLLLNTRPLNATGLDSEATLTANLRFGTLDLNAGDLTVTRLIHDNTPARDFQTFETPRAHGAGIIGDYWRTKTIRMRGYIRKSTNSALESALDNMKKVLSEQSGNLDIVVDGTVRRYKATLVNGASMFSGREHYHVTFCPFELEFACLTPFARKVGYSFQTFYDKTDLSFSEEVINAGSAPAKGVVVVVFSAADSVTKVKFENTTKSEAMEVETAFFAGDYLEIDSENLTVKKNGTAVDFTGVFPEIDPGVNAYTLTVTGTSATYTITVKHRDAFL